MKKLYPIIKINENLEVEIPALLSSCLKQQSFAVLQVKKDFLEQMKIFEQQSTIFFEQDKEEKLKFQPKKQDLQDTGYSLRPEIKEQFQIRYGEHMQWSNMKKNEKENLINEK